MFYFFLGEKSITKKKCTIEFVKQLNVGKLSTRTSCILKIFYAQSVKEV